jgi:hypothetical protein
MSSSRNTSNDWQQGCNILSQLDNAVAETRELASGSSVDDPVAYATQHRRHVAERMRQVEPIGMSSSSSSPDVNKQYSMHRVEQENRFRQLPSTFDVDFNANSPSSIGVLNFIYCTTVK